MSAFEEVHVGSMDPGRFRAVLGDRFDQIERGIVQARELFDGRVVWHVNSTARGGGVAELLQSLLAYTRGAGVDARWGVVGGDPEFFAVTKRLHNHLHGARGRRGDLGHAERAVYERTLAPPRRSSPSWCEPRRGLPPRSADGRDGRAATRDRRGGRLALPRRPRPAQRAGPRRLGLPSPLRGGRRRVRLLPSRGSSGITSTGADLARRAVDRRLLAEEPGARRGPCGRSCGARARRRSPAPRAELLAPGRDPGAGRPRAPSCTRRSACPKGRS